MKNALISATILAGMIGATGAAAQTAQPQEIGYAGGSLGYQRDGRWRL